MFKTPNDLPAEFLRQCFDYNEKTGQLTWRPRPPEHFDTNQAWVKHNRSFVGKVAGTVRDDGQVQVRLNKRACMAHRIIWCMYYGSYPERAVKHRNGNCQDNRISNLYAAEKR